MGLSRVEEEFLDVVERDGLSYAVNEYFGPEGLLRLPPGRLRDYAVSASLSMELLREEVDSLLEDREFGEL